jgi:6-phosphofructokinase 1
MLKQQDTEIKTLGKSSISSPLPELMCNNILSIKFISDDSRVLFDDTVCNGDDRNPEAPSFECAGPREKIFFDPSKTKAGIVTCGGLCPGLNDVVRAIVLGLWHNYGVRRIYGFHQARLLARRAESGGNRRLPGTHVDQHAFHHRRRRHHARRAGYRRGN